MAEPAATSLFPIVSTVDLERALGFYRDVLGGAVSYEFKGPGGEVVYAGLDIGSSHLGVGLSPAPVAAGAISLWVYVTDCDAMVERLRAAGASITEEPADQPWGERIARALDPDGNEVILGARR